MAIMIPNLSEVQLSEIESRGEIQVYKALKGALPDTYIVFSQVAWILKNENDKARDGETDFVICHPSYGYLCIEVKGGGVIFEATTNKWVSIDASGAKNLIKDPIQQAKNAKYSILKKLQENPRWLALGMKKIGIGHAVFFPDINDASKFIRPDMPINLIGTKKNIIEIKKWVDDCFIFWKEYDKLTTPIGQQGIEIFKETFAKSFKIKMLLSTSIENEEKIRVDLTEQQITLLDILRRQRRVVVSGGAGTGKTMIAVEKAKRLANEGFKTLLVCYNRPLADHLKEICRNTKGLSVMTFHQLCYSAIEESKKLSNRDLLDEARKTYPGKNEFDVVLPTALSYSLDIISERYDAIVCDEGQDFKEEYWFPLELMLADDNNSPFYIFYDDNQNLYSRVSSFPISESNLYPLSKNCRNTIQIHKAAYKYYKGESVKHSNIDGRDLEFEIGINIDKQAGKIHKKILQLLTEEKVSADKIVILVADAIYKSNYINALKNYSFPKGIAIAEEARTNDILITTINKFKGLESEIVFVWGMGFINLEKFREHIYVGISRAKFMVFIVGDNETCTQIKEKLEKDNEDI